MVAIKNLIVLATAVAAHVIPRDAATVKKDLQTINSDTTALTSAVNAYNGGLINAIPVQNAESQLEKDIKQGSSDASASGPVTDADAQSIIDYINNTLEPNIKSSISALIAKKANFQKDGLSNTVLTDLNNIKSETDTLGSNLIAKAPSAEQAGAKAALAKIDSDLQTGITAFS